MTLKYVAQNEQRLRESNKYPNRRNQKNNCN